MKSHLISHECILYKRQIRIVSCLILMLTILHVSCKKSVEKTDSVVNGINVNKASSSLNSFRVNGVPGYRGVAPVYWNDTLAQAAYNFAKAKAEDAMPNSRFYELSNGMTIFDFPPTLHYSRLADFALYREDPSDADVSTVISSVFTKSRESDLKELMNPNALEFGIEQFGGKWYLYMAN